MLTSTHSKIYLAVPGIIGAVEEKVVQRFEDNFILRIAEIGSDVAMLVPWMTLSHEIAHQNAGRRNNVASSIQFYGWMNAATHFHDIDPGVSLYTAGVNQETLNYYFGLSRWKREELRHIEVIATLLAQTNLPLYAAKSTIKTVTQDDLAIYEERSSVKVSDVAATAIATTIASGSFWSALTGLSRFLIAGDRNLEMLEWKLGSFRLNPPDFAVFLAPDRILVSGNITLKYGDTLSVTQYVTGSPKDIAAEAAVELNLNQFSAYMAGGLDSHLGFKFSARTQYMLTETLGVSTECEFRNNYMMSEVDLIDGFTFGASILLGI
jgi:hypothetical protein